MNWDRPGFLRQDKPTTVGSLDTQERRKITRMNRLSKDKNVEDSLRMMREISSEADALFNRGSYPFLTPIGSESFDDRILKNIINSYKRRTIKMFGRSTESFKELKERKPKLRDEALNIYGYHIGAYKSIFEEVERRNPALEVYIGRDAIFMYAARRAYLWGCGKSARNIKYLEFPKEFTVPEGDPQILREYLRDRGISDATNALFIDTGFYGSVPSYILRKIFKFSDENEIAKRILMIASRDSKWELKGWDPNDIFSQQRNYVAHQIEKASKPTGDTIRGLYRHPHTEKLMAYALPSSEYEILAHEFIKYLCMRFFYLKGRSEQNNVKS